MPHDRAEQENQVRAKYDHVIFSGSEFGLGTAVGLAVAAALSGGDYTYAFMLDEAKKFSVDVAQGVVDLRINPADYEFVPEIMTFHTWETPFGTKVNTGDKIVPFVGLRKI
jgi:hypothetical protein